GGEVRAWLEETISSPVLLSLMDTLNPFRKTSPYTPFECGIADAEIDGGKAIVDPIAWRTDKLTVVGHGKLNFRNEGIGLYWRLKPRRGVGVSTALVTNQFIKLGGTLANPRLGIRPIEAAATIEAGFLTFGWSVLLEWIYDRITAEQNVCDRALAKARKLEEKRNAKNSAASEH